MTDSTNDKQELSEKGEPIGIEADKYDESILDPFDPESISIDQKSVPMDTLLRRLKQKSINLTPSFQRNEVWDDRNRSRLIESIMLKIPLPMFYVASDEEGNWEVVDGLQRLSTIRNFLLGDGEGKELVLEKLEFLGKRLNGKTFSQIKDDRLHQRLVNTILETELRFTVINPGTPEAVKRNIFKRINTGGLPLTPQEIRNALYQGKSTELLIELVNSAEFESTISGTINDTRMGARELVLYFLSFHMFHRKDYRSNVDNWLSNTLQVINEMPNPSLKKLQKIYIDIPELRYKSIDELRINFKKAMKRSKKLFGEHSFRKSLPGDKHRTPINKALFETWSNILCDLSDDDFILLSNNKKKMLCYYKMLLRGDIKNSPEKELPEYKTPNMLSILEGNADTKKANYYNKLFFNDATPISLIEVFYDTSISNFENYEINLRYKNLLEGKALDDAISRHASDPKNVIKRFTLIKNMVLNTIKELKND